MDQNKKTMRHFYCRDVLWDTFEQMAADFDCSIDYLINEAMRYYARSRNYAPPQGPGPGPGQAQPSVAQQRPPQGGMSQDLRRPAQEPQRRPPPPPPPPQQSAAGAPSYSARETVQQSNRRQQAPSHSVDAVGPGQQAPILQLVFNNQRIPIDKDQFIIGRGSKSSDLAIKDGNISRKHAAVIRRNGTYYIKDLGSTNGIDYKGMRIDNKRIDEGDIFHLCDYELRFTYRQ
jgi:pSer/pThr/pTyr-binding forkhead associated (FHA) protein